MDVDGGQGIIRCGLHHVERIVLDPGLDACDYTIEVRVEDYDRDESTAIPCMCLVKVLAAFDVTVVCVQYDCTEHDVFVTRVLLLRSMGALCASCDVAGTARRVLHSLCWQDFNTFVIECRARRCLVHSYLSDAVTRWIALPLQKHRVTCGSTFHHLGITCKAKKISRSCLCGLAQGRARCSSRVGLRTTQNIRSKATSTSSQLLGVRATL